MKSLKTMWGVAFSFSTLLLITSCSKSLNEQQAKEGNEVSMAAKIPSLVCFYEVGMQIRNNAGGSYFWVGPNRTNVNLQTPFSGLDFSDNQLINVSALPVSASAVPNHNIAGEHMGVASNFDKTGHSADPTRINEGETLVFKLGTSISDFLFRGVVFQMQAQGRAGKVGEVRFFRNGVQRDFKDIINPTPTNKNFGFNYESGLTGYFDEIRIVCTGPGESIRINARNSNGPNGTTSNGTPLLPPTQFLLVARAGAYVEPNGNPVPLAQRPAVVGVNNLGNNYPLLQNNNGVFATDNGFNFLNTPVEYLKFSSNYPLYYRKSSHLLSVAGIGNDAHINPGEIITIEPGPDFYATTFSGIQIRVAHGAIANPLEVKFWNGTNQVGPTRYTNGINNDITSFYSNTPFNRVTIEGTGNAATIRFDGPGLRLLSGCKIEL